MSEPNAPENFKPYVPASEHPPEFTVPAVLVGAVLGIIFGASSLYLVLKVGMTVSASIPVAVLSITLFRWFSKTFGIRRATILENNIVQTTGSAGESIAFGVGVTMPALLLLGFEMDVVRVMTVSVLGGLLGILMMIPLRRAFIVKQHGKLIYPEGTACAEVLVAGEKGGATARMVFLGFGIAAVHKLCSMSLRLWSEAPSQNLYTVAKDGTKHGLKGASISGELAPELMGVGFLIGPRIASLMMAGAVLSYWVIGPLIAGFGENLQQSVSPATGGELIRDMDPSRLKRNYLVYIGAGAVAAGGIISMMRALPLILSSIVSGLRDMRAARLSGGSETLVRTERDLSMNVVLYGSLAMVVALMLVPSLGLGFTFKGLLGAVMILVFGFLFVTVSSRLTGEIGSSSNPISGMTIATLLLTCIIFWLSGQTLESDKLVTLSALTIAAVVCIASSNGGTTSQDLKTGYLVGGTPRYQQLAILVGALTSALVIGGTMLALDSVGTHYTTRNLPTHALEIPEDAPKQRVGRPYNDSTKKDFDDKEYHIVHVRKVDSEKRAAMQLSPVAPGRYLVEADGIARYRTDTPIEQQYDTMDNGQRAPKPFDAPQPQLFQSIIEGILGGTLEWGLFVIGVLVALSMELAGVRSLPFAVGMYIPLGSSTPIFIGGLLRWGVDRLRGVGASDVETETSPGVLLSSGYIAGGTLCGLIVAFFFFLPQGFRSAIDFSPGLGSQFADDPAKLQKELDEIDHPPAPEENDEGRRKREADEARKDEATKKREADEAAEDRALKKETLRSRAWTESVAGRVVAVLMFGVLGAILFYVGLQRTPQEPLKH
jgi:putative OPT family oligopeptide transporter